MPRAVGEVEPVGEMPDLSPRLKEIGISVTSFLDAGTEDIQNFWLGAYVLLVIDGRGEFWLGQSHPKEGKIE